ncbi:MAG: RluA family pseudouridine synthase [Bacteroidia bacterium]|nr:RluA family pseudouridine synthase [Bacteroidia bacterium]
MQKKRFTYPFRYVPAPETVEASHRIIERIEHDEYLKSIFKEGKMLGVLIVERPDGSEDSLYGFSGLAGGRSIIEGFVPPIFDLQDPEGRFKKEEAAITALNIQIKECGDSYEASVLKARRKSMSNDLQDWIFKQYVVLNALGEKKSILDIFAERGLVPPGGTGDCAAPKLLQYAYMNGLRPIAMGEFWYGDSPAKEIRRQGCFYPSCTGKCGPLLSFMLEGLEVEPNPLDAEENGRERIIFEDDDIIIADKPSGMLAVPGRTMKVSLQERLQKERLGVSICSCHRLDMDTSGLIVFAKGTENQAIIQQQFEMRQVSKTYIARLEAGTALARNGRIILPLMPDWYDRPRQMVDFENGKQAVTDWELLRTLPDGRADVRFTPLTGRTHQLRVHSAHPQGLGRPIQGDRLYGGGNGKLCLHAATLEFAHPRTGDRMFFESEPRFEP